MEQAQEDKAQDPAKVCKVAVERAVEVALEPVPAAHVFVRHAAKKQSTRWVCLVISSDAPNAEMP